MPIYFYANNNMMFTARQMKWQKDRTFMAHGAGLTWCLNPKTRTVEMNDTGRVWTGSQSFNLIFSEAVTSTGVGWSATVNGVAAGMTYVSGSGAQTLVFSFSVVVHRGDVILFTYNRATGDTVSVTGSVEINALNAVRLGDQLTKRIRFILCDSTSTSATPVPVASETVKAALMEYDGGVVDDPPERLWMFRVNAASVVTDADGQFDMQYTGEAAVGGTAIAAVFRTGGQNVIGTQTVV